MTPANHSEACGICPDCGLLPWIPHRNPSCTGQGNAFCKDNTIARLRSELSTIRAAHDKLVALSEAERALVDATVACYHAARECVDEEQEVYRRARRDAVRALLELRKGNADANR